MTWEKAFVCLIVLGITLGVALALVVIAAVVNVARAVP